MFLSLLFLFQCVLLDVNCTEVLLQSNFVTSTFSTKEGWSVAQGNPGYGIIQNGQTIFGGVNYFESGTQIQKGFMIPPHYMLRIQITIWAIGKWENGEINLLCEEKRIFSQSLYSMLDFNYSAPISLNVVTTHNAGTAILQVRPSQQNQHSQSWGIRDFSISYYPCPSGCVTCSKIDTSSTCSQWVLGYSQFTQLSITEMTNEGWFVNDNTEYFRFSQCNGLPYFGNYLAGMSLKRTYFLEPHKRIRIQFLFIKLNNWDQAQFFLSVDEVIQQQLEEKTDIYHNINYCDNNSGLDSITRYTLDFSHTKQLANFQIYTTLSQTQTIHSFGIRDFTIFIEQCNTCTEEISFFPTVIQYFTEMSFCSSDGWIVRQLKDVTTLNQACALGSFFGSFGGGAHITRTFKLTSHKKVKIEMACLLINTWDLSHGDLVYIYINGNLDAQYQKSKADDGIAYAGCGPVLSINYRYEQIHTSNTITVSMDVVLNEDLGNESFGMRDFRLQLADCPFDCGSCNNIVGDHCQYQYRDEYWNLNETNFIDGGGWGQQLYVEPSTIVTQCNGRSILAGKGSITNKSYLQLTYVLQAHNKIRLIFKLYIIGDWQDDEILIKVNDFEFYRKRITTSYSNFNCESNLQGFIIHFDSVLDNTSDTLIIDISYDTNLSPTSNKSYGIRDVFIYYQIV